jgi:hypothetical protein
MNKEANLGQISLCCHDQARADYSLSIDVLLVAGNGRAGFVDGCGISEES